VKILEQLHEDYILDADILQQDLHDKIIEGLVYWNDLDFHGLELDMDVTDSRRINKTGVMQNILSDLNKLVLEDALTGLYNRRYFNRALESEMMRNNRENRHLSLAILDVDFFKHINDTYGHDGGDEVLKALAIIMHKNVRQSDALMRIGGEEFAVIMPNVRHNVAVDVMERLRKDIENLVIPFNNEKIRTSVSVGITVLEPNKHASVDELYKQADKALYRAKKMGRNKVVLHGKPMITAVSVEERQELMS